MRATVRRMIRSDPVGPFQERQSLLDGLPEVSVDDPQLWVFLANPFFGRPRQRRAAPRIRVLDRSPLAPSSPLPVLVSSFSATHRRKFTKSAVCAQWN